MLLLLLIQAAAEHCHYPAIGISKGRKPNWTSATAIPIPSNRWHSTFMSLCVCASVCVCVWFAIYTYVCVCMYVCFMNWVLFSNLFWALCCLPVVTIVRRTKIISTLNLPSLLPPSLPPSLASSERAGALCHTIGPPKWIATSDKHISVISHVIIIVQKASSQKDW